MTTYKLLALDVDGTLVRRDGSIHDEDFRAIQRLQDAGVPVSIATGRLYSGTREVARRIGVLGPIACVDGSHIVHTEGDAHLGDFIEDKNAMSPGEAALDADLAEATRAALASLTPREEKVLRMRYGIGEKSDHTLEEVGRDFAVTRERIRQIEAKALGKLRHPSRAAHLRSFFDS